jgi:hypothetical protein
MPADHRTMEALAAITPEAVAHLKAEYLSSAFSGLGYLDPITAAGIISNLKASGTLAGFNLWSVAYDVDNSMWSSQVKAHLT